jgi:pimeloyl-ACP methyl ester carboxylesterase
MNARYRQAPVVTPHTRRDFLRTSSLAGAAAALALAVPTQAAAAAARHRAGQEAQATFVFVTGLGGGSAPGYPEVALDGHRAIGVPLPGHGPGQFTVAYQAPQDLGKLATQWSPMAGVTLDDYASSAIDIVRRVADNGPVILVGSSLGGATVSRVANAIPRLLDRIVYDAAFCCVALSSVTDYWLTPEGSTNLANDVALAGAVGDPAQLGASRTNWRLADPKFLAAAKAAFMADGTDAELLALLSGLEPDESLDVVVADARGHASTWGKVPRTFIRHTGDRTIPIALQDRMIREADALTPHNRFDVRSVDTGHVASTSKARRIAAILSSLP